MSSNDDWTTCDILFIFRGHCSGGYMSTIAYTGQDMSVLCTDYYKNGPYQIRTMNNSNNIITNGNVIYQNDQNNNGNDNGDKSQHHKVVILVLVLCSAMIVLFGVATTGYYLLHYHKKQGEVLHLEENLLERY